MVPWTLRLPFINIDETGKTAYKVRPDPDRLVEFIAPPEAGNRPKDPEEVLTVATHMQNPTLFYFDKDLTMITGSIVAEKAGAAVEGLDPGVYYSDNDKAFKTGFKIYKTGPFVAGDPWEIKVNNNDTRQLEVVATLTIITKNPEGGLQAGAYTTTSLVLAAKALSTAGFNSWGGIQAASEQNDVVGFTLSFLVLYPGDVDSSVISNHGDVFGIIWPTVPADRPVFGQAYTWVAKSLWEIKGAPAASLRAEWDNANSVAVTGCSMNCANVSAVMNLNGDIFGTIIKPSSSSDPPANPSLLFEFINGLNVDAFRMQEPIKADTGVHCVLPLTDKDCAFLPVDTFRKLDRQSNTVNYRPYIVVAVIADNPVVASTKPALTLSGVIHLEWRTNSMLCTPRRPPTNLAFFNQIRSQLMLDLEVGRLWTHNPDHFKKLKKFAHKIVTSNTFKTILRDASEVGIAALTTMLLA